MKKIKKTDFLFVAALFSVLLLHIFFVNIYPYSNDETFYPIVPFRMMNGESLIQYEWNLTQFSSLFNYLPVFIWMKIKGSADGIFIFLRCIYLVIHTLTAAVIYKFFRKYGVWAVMASMMFYVQLPYRISAISYHTVFLIALLLMTFCFISVYEKKSEKYYIPIGVCYGCCCVCNPVLCVLFPIYLIGYILWTKRVEIKIKISKLQGADVSKNGKKLTKKQKKQQEQQIIESLSVLDGYGYFLEKKAVLQITKGLAAVAVIAVAFFFITGGTVNSIFDNLANLLGSSEYGLGIEAVFEKIFETLSFFSTANLGMPWILPLIFAVLIMDKKRKLNSHRFGYLFAVILWSALFIYAVFKNYETGILAISLPFSVFSLVCYILTENKNKTLFRLMYIPCLIGTFFHYVAANSYWFAIGIVLAIGNVAGVFFAMDLFREMGSVPTEDTEAKSKNPFAFLRGIIIVGFCLQLVFYVAYYQFGQVPGKDAEKATAGTFKGMYMTEEKYETYNKVISDLDYIKSISDEDSPVLLASFNNWMYLYLDRPVATYTAWYRGTLYAEVLTEYYKENPENYPEYIYIETFSPDGSDARGMIDKLDDTFDFTQEVLSKGVLLTVK